MEIMYSEAVHCLHPTSGLVFLIMIIIFNLKANILIIGHSNVNKILKTCFGATTFKFSCSILLRVPTQCVPDIFAEPSRWRPLMLWEKAFLSRGQGPTISRGLGSSTSISISPFTALFRTESHVYTPGLYKNLCRTSDHGPVQTCAYYCLPARTLQHCQTSWLSASTGRTHRKHNFQAPSLEPVKREPKRHLHSKSTAWSLHSSPARKAGGQAVGTSFFPRHSAAGLFGPQSHSWESNSSKACLLALFSWRPPEYHRSSEIWFPHP